MTLVCEDGNSKLVEVVTVVDDVTDVTDANSKLVEVVTVAEVDA